MKKIAWAWMIGIALALVPGVSKVAQPVARETSCPPKEPNTFCILLGGESSVTFSPDGQWLAAVFGRYDPISGFVCNIIRVWRTADWQLAYEIELQPYDCVQEVAFSPDSTILAFISNDRIIRLWDVSRQKEIRTLYLPPTAFGYPGPLPIAFSPDGKLLASATCMGGQTIFCNKADLIFWNTTTGAVVRHIPFAHLGFITDIAFSPDGKLVATASDDFFSGVRLWEVATGHRVQDLFLKGAKYARIAFSPDSRLLAAVNISGMLFVGEVASGRQLAFIREFGGNDDIEFSPNGQFLVGGFNQGPVGKEHQLTIWKVGDWQVARFLTMPWDRDPDSLAFSHNGELLAVGEWSFMENQESWVRLWYVGDWAK